MAQTITQLFLHVVFSTKNRIDLIRPEIESELFAYIGGILKSHDCVLLAANGSANHVHLLISISKNVRIPDLVGDLKRGSSKWIKTKGGMLAKFDWQDGYSAFSVGHSQLRSVEKYIAGQKEHHAERLFEDEMRELYGRVGVDFNERFVWG